MDPLATGRPDESAAPILLEQPEDAFVVKSKPATLSCRAAHALQLYFVCNGEAVRQKHHSQHEFVDPMTGIRQLGIITPFGGTLFLIGWCFALAGAWRHGR